MLLVDRRDPRGLGEADLARIRVQLAEDDLEQR
jgi:hypothetical protein